MLDSNHIWVCLSHNGCVAVRDAFLEVCEAFLAADLNITEPESFLRALAPVQILGRGQEHWDSSQSRIYLTALINRVFAHTIVAFDRLIAAVARFEEIPELLVHEFEMLPFTHLIAQVRVHYFCFKLL